MRAVDLLLRSKLPENIRNSLGEGPIRTDAKGISDLMTRVARENPDEYASVLKAVGDVGRKAAYFQGETLRLNDLRPALDMDTYYGAMDEELDIINNALEGTFASEEDKFRSKMGVYAKYSDIIEKDTMEQGMAQGNNLAYTAHSGARGKPGQIKSMLSTPALYTDYKGDPIPLFVRNSFSGGLRPGEYLAGTFGARMSVISTKTSTAKGGDAGKQLSSVGSHVVVSSEDCGTLNGIDLPMEDDSLKGRVLAQDTAGLPGGTILDRSALSEIRAKGVKKLMARSALTCLQPEGICSKCSGLNEYGRLPKLGESVGNTAAHAIREPLCLHADTEVRMADWSVKRIKNIIPGDKVLGADMEGFMTSIDVVNVFHNGIRPCFKTKVRKGCGRTSEVIELISTKEHKVLSIKGSKSFKNMKPSIQPIEMSGSEHTRHRVVLHKELIQDHGKDEPLAPVLGMLTGDGCYNGGFSSKGIGFSCYDPVLEAWLRAFLKPSGINLATTTTPGEFRLSMVDQYGSFETINGNLVRNTIKGVLIKEGMWGQRSGDKTLPKTINSWNNKSVAQYIGGLVDTDGWILKATDTSSGVGISSNSEILLKGVKDLLEVRFGIYCTRITGSAKANPVGGHYDPTFSLYVTGTPNVKAFHNLIPLFGVKKERLNEAVKALNNPRQSRGRYKVISQEFVGNLDTWDIEVNNDTHLFVLANSMVVSNTQSALSAKHGGGAFSGEKSEYSGFEVLNQIIQSPKVFPHRASVAEAEGTVNSVEPASQGGFNIRVGETNHYVPPGYDVIAKPGDTVELGDQLSEGIVDPKDIVALRGLGEGRRYYAERLKKVLDDSGIKTNLRHTEHIARAAIDHVEIDDPDGMDGMFIVGDTTSYNSLISKRPVPENAKMVMADHKAIGKYLQSPTLHYSVGTKLTRKMLDRITDSGINKLPVSDSEPEFTPSMARLRTSAASNHSDWLANLASSYQKTNIGNAALRGDDGLYADSPHFAGPLAYGADFGKNIETTGRF